MPSIYDLKPKFQSLLRPLIKRLAKWGFKPNAITGIAILGSVGVGLLILRSTQQPALLLLVPIWLFMRMALNAIDGMLARELQMATPLGAVLNEMATYFPISDFICRWLFCMIHLNGRSLLSV
jgi:CDP-diacylglycerol--glycerol-3-phosphate 3-phosphatidyltransferase